MSFYLKEKDIDVTNWNILSDRSTHQHLNDYFQTTIDSALKEGYQKGQKDLADRIMNLLISEINNYTKLATSVADNAIIKTKEHFKNTINVIETRANFLFGTHRIKLLLIIDGDYRKEIEFAKLLETIERDALEKNKFLCEILYINKKDTKLNITSIEIDFPLYRLKK